jgi:hypothetical protein
MRITTIILSILDIAVAIVIAYKLLGSESDPATMGLDVGAGWAVTILCLITALPAVFLALKTQRGKTALALALAFPVGLGALIGAVLIYLQYM